MCENERVQKEVAALRENRFGEFLRLVKESGDSSYKYLQNVYVCHDVEHQNVSIALAISDMILGVQGANRVHGGGFAGTIQAFVPNDIVTLYKTCLLYTSHIVLSTDQCLTASSQYWSVDKTAFTLVYHFVHILSTFVYRHFLCKNV